MVTLDPLTGVATELGEAGITPFRHGLAFDAADNLYLFNFEGDVRLVDPATGSVGGQLFDTDQITHHGDFDPSTGRYFGIESTSGTTNRLEIIDVELGGLFDNVAVTAADLHTITFVDAAEVPLVSGEFTEFNGALYFLGFTPAHGSELWRYDGTGFARVSDIVPGQGSSAPLDLAVFDDAVYFSAFFDDDFNWSTLGAADAPGITLGVAPTEGGRQALVDTSDPISDGALEGFLGLSSRAIDAVVQTSSPVGAVEGAAVARQVHVDAGQTLSFDWSFRTNETVKAPQFNDSAFFSIARVDGGSGLSVRRKITRSISHLGMRDRWYSSTRRGTSVVRCSRVRARDRRFADPWDKCPHRYGS